MKIAVIQTPEEKEYFPLFHFISRLSLFATDHMRKAYVRLLSSRDTRTYSFNYMDYSFQIVPIFYGPDGSGFNLSRLDDCDIVAFFIPSGYKEDSPLLKDEIIRIHEYKPFAHSYFINQSKTCVPVELFIQIIKDSTSS